MFGAPVALTRTLIIIYDVAEERCREKMRHERKMDSDQGGRDGEGTPKERERGEPDGQMGRQTTTRDGPWTDWLRAEPKRNCFFNNPPDLDKIS